MAERMIPAMSIEQQIASVQQALDKLRRAKRFRGQDEVIGDMIRQLAILVALQRRGAGHTHHSPSVEQG